MEVLLFKYHKIVLLYITFFTTDKDTTQYVALSLC